MASCVFGQNAILKDLRRKTFGDLTHPQNRELFIRICNKLDTGVDNNCFVKLAYKAKERGYFDIKNPQRLKNYFSSNGRTGSEFLHVLVTRFPELTVDEFIEVAEQFERRDICLELKKFIGCSLKNIDAMTLQEIGWMLNQTPNNTIKSWKDFFHHFFYNISDLDMLESSIELTGKNVDTLSPSQKLFELISEKNPNTDLVFLVKDLELIKRGDIADYIDKNIASIKSINGKEAGSSKDESFDLGKKCKNYVETEVNDFFSYNKCNVSTSAQIKIDGKDLLKDEECINKDITESEPESEESIAFSNNKDSSKKSVALYSEKVERDECIAADKICESENRVEDKNTCAEKIDNPDLPLGQCVVISNSIFKGSFLKRLYSKNSCIVDQEVIEEKFKEHGFRTYLYQNQSIIDIKSNLTKHSVDDHSSCKAFVCCLLAKGDDGCIYDKEKNKLQVDEVINIFSKLSGIPKLFIVRTIEKKNQKLKVYQDDEHNTYLLHSKNKDIDGETGSTFINRICKIVEKCDKGDVHGLIEQLMKANVLE